MDEYQADKFFQIEYIGSKLSKCTGLAYLSDGFVYYGSKFGDSFLLRLEQEHTLDPDRPYYTIVRVFSNIGAIKDMLMKDQADEGV